MLLLKKIRSNLTYQLEFSQIGKETELWLKLCQAQLQLKLESNISIRCYYVFEGLELGGWEDKLKNKTRYSH